MDEGEQVSTIKSEEQEIEDLRLVIQHGIEAALQNTLNTDNPMHYDVFVEHIPAVESIEVAFIGRKLG